MKWRHPTCWEMDSFRKAIDPTGSKRKALLASDLQFRRLMLHFNAQTLPRPKLKFEAGRWWITGPMDKACRFWTSFSDIDPNRAYWRWLSIYATTCVREITDAVHHDGVYGLGTKADA